MRWLAALTAMLAFSSCHHEEPNFIYMPDMVYSPAFKAQKEGSMLLPPAGTVPRGFVRYPYAINEVARAGRELRNPLPRSSQVLARGQAMFNTYCIVCHGPAGMGDGTIIPKFPRPPSLQSDKIRGAPDGHLYHVITMGQNMMPSYASQVLAGDRWAIIHYIRALQRSKHPTPEDLAASGQ